MDHVKGVQDFDTKIKGAPVAVFDFTATWCGPCKMLGPILEDLSKEYDPARVQFFKVDVDQNNELANRFGVSAVPTVIFTKGGNVQKTLLVGVRNKADYKKVIEDLLK